METIHVLVLCLSIGQIFAISPCHVDQAGHNLIFTQCVVNMTECACRNYTQIRKIEVDCTGLNLTSIPENIPQEVTNLILTSNKVQKIDLNPVNQEGSKFKHVTCFDISKNVINKLHGDEFQGLTQLQKLFLSNNRLEVNTSYQPYGENAFKPLVNSLLVLDIRNNSVNRDASNLAYPSKELSRLESLQELQLDYIPGKPFGNDFNSLKNLSSLIFSGGRPNGRYLHDNAFQNITDLPIKKVNLSGLSIGMIDATALKPFKYLEVLDLSYNQNMGHQILDVLVEISLKTIKELYLNKTGIGNCVQTVINNLKGSKLTVLVLDHNHIYDLNGIYLNQMLPYLEVFSIQHNFLYGCGTSEVAMDMMAWTSIKYLYLCCQYDDSDLDDGDEEAMEQLAISNEVCDTIALENKYAELVKQKNKELEKNKESVNKEKIVKHTDYVKNKELVTNKKLVKYREVVNDEEVVKNKELVKSGKLEMHICMPTSGRTCPVKIPPNLTAIDLSNYGFQMTKIPQLGITTNSTLKQVVVSRSGIIAVPYRLYCPHHILGIQRLDLTDNAIQCVNSSVFHMCTLNSLYEVQLGGNRLGINDGNLCLNGPNQTMHFLQPLQNVTRKLDISRNQLNDSKLIQSLDDHISLQNLNLSGNFLKSLPINISKMVDLRILDLSHNRIECLSQDAWRTIEQVQLKKQVKSNESRLVLDMTGNPLQCQCQCLEFYKWMSTTKVFFKNSNFYTCKSDDGVIINLNDINSVVVKMTSECTTMLWFTISFTVVFFVHCTIAITTITYRFRHTLRYQWIKMQMNRKRFQQMVRKGHIEFDAFISCDVTDAKNFVMPFLLPKLETKETGLKFCIAQRNFKVGVTIVDNILNAIDYSRKTIFIISKYFLMSGWCKEELRMAQQVIRQLIVYKCKYLY